MFVFSQPDTIQMYVVNLPSSQPLVQQPTRNAINNKYHSTPTPFFNPDTNSNSNNYSWLPSTASPSPSTSNSPLTTRLTLSLSS